MRQTVRFTVPGAIVVGQLDEVGYLAGCVGADTFRDIGWGADRNRSGANILVHGEGILTLDESGP